MGPWLLIVVVAVTVVLWRLAGIAGMIWQEWTRVHAHCIQMEAAAASGSMLCERLPDGTTLVVMPGSASQEHVSVAEQYLRSAR
jgi:hypothetical protein